MRALILAASTLFVLAGCGSPAPADVSIIEVDDAFIVKPAEGRDITGGGMVVKLVGPEQTLIGAETDVAGRVELHTMSMQDGKMQMRKVEGFKVTKDEPLVLERGGHHLMLFEVDESLEIGDTIDIVLKFDDGAGSEQFIVTKAQVLGQGG